MKFSRQVTDCKDSLGSFGKHFSSPILEDLMCVKRTWLSQPQRKIDVKHLRRDEKIKPEILM